MASQPSVGVRCMQLKQLPEKLGLIPLDTFGFSLEERQHIPIEVGGLDRDARDAPE
jgi:hypothetical protein